MEKEKINLTDKNNNPVYVGDTFLAYISRPSIFPPTKVKVVKDISPSNLECDRDYDVEDEKGNRIWNAYMVVKNGEKITY